MSCPYVRIVADVWSACPTQFAGRTETGTHVVEQYAMWQITTSVHDPVACDNVQEADE
jgi:hypothetical protein